MADARKKQLVFNIIDFLKTSTEDGTVKEDDKESMEVAIQCLAESFGVDPDSENDKKSYSIAPANLVSLLDVYLKTKAKSSSAPAAASPSSGAGASASASPSSPAAASASGPESKAAAEALKLKGNALMSQKLYDSAIEQYTEAIKLDANPVYYSNRAAAWGGLGEHSKAVEDAQKAIELDPKFSKAYSRLGHAHFSNGDYQSAVDAYESGLELDPSNPNMKSALATANARLAETSSNSVADREPSSGGGGGAGAGGMPDMAGLASMLGGMGGGGGRGGAGGMPDMAGLASMLGGMGGGGGGMPDIASMMRNPQMMQMAQQMMANGGLDRLMQNPNIRNMAEQMQNGGGMPDLSTLAEDPTLREMAEQYRGGGGAGGAGAGAGRGGQ